MKRIIDRTFNQFLNSTVKAVFDTSIDVKPSYSVYDGIWLEILKDNFGRSYVALRKNDLFSGQKVTFTKELFETDSFKKICYDAPFHIYCGHIHTRSGRVCEVDMIDMFRFKIVLEWYAEMFPGGVDDRLLKIIDQLQSS